MWVAKDTDTKEIVYWAGSKALQQAGMRPEDLYNSLRHVDKCVKTNMAGKRGVAVGNGFIGAMGIRYRYTEPVLSEREKLASTAATDPQLYQSILGKVQEIANVTVELIMTWSADLRQEMEQLQARMKVLLPVCGTACATYPMASVGKQGAFACHKDSRDTRTTVWSSLRHGGLAFPAYEHLLELGPGDVIAFNGKEHMHANCVFPCDGDEAENLPEQLQNLIICLYYQSQQESYLENSHERQQQATADVDAARRFVDTTNDHLHDSSVLREAPPFVLRRLRNICNNFLTLNSMGADGTYLSDMGISPSKLTAIRKL